MSHHRQALKLAASIVVTSLACGCRTADSGASGLREAGTASAAGPLGAQQWIDHYRNDLLPFWSSVEAQGTPIGNFPTFRCNDGSLFIAAHPCIELSKSEDWIRTELGRDYVRMQSRQAFFYGVGFNITGDPKLLALAKAGVDYIRQHAIQVDGSLVTYWQAGEADKLGDAATKVISLWIASEFPPPPLENDADHSDLPRSELVESGADSRNALPRPPSSGEFG